MKQSDIIGKPVMDTLGNKISKIDNIFYSKSKDMILAFSISKNKILSISQIIEFSEIHSIGRDALMLKNCDNFKKNNFIEDNYYNCQTVLNQEIFSQDGGSLGFVKDILLNSKKGTVIGFIITQGLFEDISNGRNVLPIDENIKLGKDNIIINQSLKEKYIKYKKDYKKLLELL